MLAPPKLLPNHRSLSSSTIIITWDQPRIKFSKKSPLKERPFILKICLLVYFKSKFKSSMNSKKLLNNKGILIHNWRRKINLAPCHKSFILRANKMKKIMTFRYLLIIVSKRNQSKNSSNNFQLKISTVALEIFHGKAQINLIINKKRNP